MKGKDQSPHRRNRGFEPAGGLVARPVRAAGEARGFAVTRLLTQWDQIVGADLARSTHPVKIGYGREGFGATLTVLTTAAHAPLLQMDLPRLRDRVNACYGYNAVARIVITQTAPAGFAEGATPFAHKPGAGADPGPDPALAATARGLAAPVADDGLRSALEKLAGNVLSRAKRN
jgi:hypothetical protein